jgi:hypothetical protein
MARRPHLSKRNDATDAPTRALRRPSLVRRPVALLVTVFATLAFVGGVATFGASASGAATDASANSVRPVSGAPGYGPDPGLTLNAPLVAIDSTPSGHGYWAAAADGGVFAKGDARYEGGAAGLPLVGPVVGISGTPDGGGYWLVAADGGVFSYGDADFFGSLGGYHDGGLPLNGPITGIASTPSGHGYWLVASDGGVFAFGDAKFAGSAASTPHAAPFVGIAATRSGNGYYLLEADGGVFTYGNARFDGSSVDGVHRSVGISVDPDGHGYVVAHTDGSIAGFGGQPSVGTPADSTVMLHPAVAVAARHGSGAWLARGYMPPPPPAPVDISQDPFLVCTRAHESDSAGGYHAVSPDGRYRGAYQFLQSTWNNIAAAAGRPDLIGVDPAQAAPHDQDELALFLYHTEGAAPWGGRCAGLP